MTHLYLDHRRLMERKARSVLRGDQGVEDVVSDACVALIGKISLIRLMECYTLRAYIVSTVRNTAINFIARRDRGRVHAYSVEDACLENAVSQEPDPLGDLIRREDIDALKRAIGGVSERERAVLTMKYFDELNDREIAQVLGIRPDSVRPFLMRARRHVYDRMKE